MDKKENNNGIQPADNITEEEFKEMIEIGYQDAINGESVPLDEAIESIRKGLKQ